MPPAPKAAGKTHQHPSDLDTSHCPQLAQAHDQLLGTLGDPVRDARQVSHRGDRIANTKDDAARRTGAKDKEKQKRLQGPYMDEARCFHSWGSKTPALGRISAQVPKDSMRTIR